MPSDTKNKAKASSGADMWGGRFAAGPDAVMQAINASIDTDRHLYREDIAGSKAHATMLAAQDIITQADCAAIHGGLDQIAGEIARGEMAFDPKLEDIHMHIEARLTDIIGEAGKRLHTARSRNDQVATDFKLFVRAEFDKLCDGLNGYIAALLDQADQHADTIMPGFTHLQTAQPVTLGHHLLAFAEMAARDMDRAKTARVRMNECPLGAAALAGTSFDIDRDMTAKTLEFSGPMHNSLDSVSSRDFALDYMYTALSVCLNLSRFAEEMIIWASASFGFIRLSDGFSTGSSIMPQKRNPDAAELVRGKVGAVMGALMGLATTMKGLPLAYSKDMQEDKAPLMRVADDIALMLAAMTGMVATLAPNTENMLAAAGDGYATATDLADALVRDLKMPFRDAHHVVGAAVKACEDAGCSLSALPLAAYQAIEPRISQAMIDQLTVEASVASRTALGGTAPDNVRREVARLRHHLTIDPSRSDP